MEKVLLWENSSPTESFAAQTLDVDFRPYKRILIEAAYNKTIGESSAAKIFEWFTDSMQNKTIITFFTMYGGFNGREITFQNGSISISKGQAGSTHSSPYSKENNDVAIPLRIFGCYY